VKFDINVSVAVKIIDKGRFSFPHDRSGTLRNEVNILRDLSHPGVVKLLNVFENGEIVCVVMEKMNGGDLLEYVLTRPDKTISERQSKYNIVPLSSP
jgi:serine/threonine/tyrosine protein kinase RAD53